MLAAEAVTALSDSAYISIEYTFNKDNKCFSVSFHSVKNLPSPRQKLPASLSMKQTSL